MTDLLRQMRDDDSERAFNALFRLEYERLFRIAFYFVKNDDWAKDVALDVFATLWERRKTMVVPNDFRHFTFKMVKNRALNMLKKEARYADLADDALEPCDEHDTLEQEEIFETYNNLVASLPDRCREVFCCVKEYGMSYAEVATQMGISTKTVDAQLQKALQTLRKGLGKYVTTSAGKRFFIMYL